MTHFCHINCLYKSILISLWSISMTFTPKSIMLGFSREFLIWHVQLNASATQCILCPLFSAYIQMTRFKVYIHLTSLFSVRCASLRVVIQYGSVCWCVITVTIVTTTAPIKWHCLGRIMDVPWLVTKSLIHCCSHIRCFNSVLNPVSWFSMLIVIDTEQIDLLVMYWLIV